MEKENENGCTCDRCENKYKIDLNLPDELWEKINPVKFDMLCPECIGELLMNLNEFGAYLLTSLTAPVPDGKEEIKLLKEKIKKLEFMIDNGLGWKDMQNDITYP